jgi:hypothetical protein
MYITFDPNNPVDQEIQKHLIHHRADGRGWHEETIIRFVLNKRLVAKNRYHSKKKTNGMNDAIEIAIKKKIERTGMSREDIIREALCIHFDIPCEMEGDCAICEEP